MQPNLQRRIDVAVEHNVAPDEYFTIWEEIGGWQLESLKSLGMKPHHRLLDFGCGALRLGLAAVDYLDSGNYYGIDAFPPYIAIGRQLAEAAEISKSFTLLASADFEFDRFGVQFDFGNAQSVFTHMSGDECDRCVAALRQVMKSGGIFFFTYLIGAPLTQGMLYLGAQPMRRFATTDPEFFAKLAARYELTFERLDMVHPTGQQVGILRF